MLPLAQGTSVTSIVLTLLLGAISARGEEAWNSLSFSSTLNHMGFFAWCLRCWGCTGQQRPWLALFLLETRVRWQVIARQLAPWGCRGWCRPILLGITLGSVLACVSQRATFVWLVLLSSSTLWERGICVACQHVTRNRLTTTISNTMKDVGVCQMTCKLRPSILLSCL
jgi:hypothetical protein